MRVNYAFLSKENRCVLCVSGRQTLSQGLSNFVSHIVLAKLPRKCFGESNEHFYYGRAIPMGRLR